MKTSKLNFAATMIATLLATTTLTSCSEDEFNPLNDSAIDASTDNTSPVALGEQQDGTARLEDPKDIKPVPVCEHEESLTALDYTSESTSNQLILLTRHDGKHYLSLPDLQLDKAPADTRNQITFEIIISGEAENGTLGQSESAQPTQDAKILRGYVGPSGEMKELNIPLDLQNECRLIQINVNLNQVDASNNILRTKQLRAAQNGTETTFLYCFNKCD